MADIFISYKKEDRALAERIIAALRAEGLSVWWDDDLTPRESWDVMIQREAEAAKAIVVLWTERSIKSEWVRIEAMFGKDRGKLVPVKLEVCELPFAFSLVQTADLSGWLLNGDDREWRRVVGWVAALVAGGAPGTLNSSAATRSAAPALAPLPVDVPEFDLDRPYVFISYPRDVDPAVMRALVRRLFGKGLPVWIYDPVPFGFEPRELSGMHYQRPGLPMEAQTPNAIKESACRVLLLSRSTVGSRFQEREAEWVMAAGRTVPLIVDDMPHEELPAKFSSLHVPRLSAVELASGAGEKILMMVVDDISKSTRTAMGDAPMLTGVTKPGDPKRQAGWLAGAAAAAVLLAAGGVLAALYLL